MNKIYYDFWLWAWHLIAEPSFQPKLCYDIWKVVFKQNNVIQKPFSSAPVWSQGSTLLSHPLCLFSVVMFIKMKFLQLDLWRSKGFPGIHLIVQGGSGRPLNPTWITCVPANICACAYMPAYVPVSCFQKERERGLNIHCVETFAPAIRLFEFESIKDSNINIEV